MTERQRKFCDSYIICGNATQAAIKAGYSPKSAYSVGARLLKNVEIQNFLKSYWKSEAELLIASVEQIAKFWTSTMTDENEKISTRLKASELLARSSGMFLADSAITAAKPDGESASVVIYLPRLDELPDKEDGVEGIAEQQVAPRQAFGD